ncbi:hypothetical protein PPS11_26744 [Pseudomonas putida S11]|nr:hypothetical protein PPS11_26744 [Pseudomonas putida S11]
MSGDRHMPALQMLLYGPWGMPFGLYQWFANPLLALAILAHRRFRRLALLVGLVAVYLAASSFGIDRLPDNQSYEFHDLTGFGAGFYLWLAAMVVFCMGQAWHCWRARSADDMPGWSWLDVVLIAALGVMFYCGNADAVAALRAGQGADAAGTAADAVIPTRRVYDPSIT